MKLDPSAGGLTAGDARREPAGWRREVLLVAGLVAAPLLRGRLGGPRPASSSPSSGSGCARPASGGSPVRSWRWRWLALIAGWAADRLERPARAERIRETRREYAEIWKDLRREAQARRPPSCTCPRRRRGRACEAFSRLSRIEIGEGKGRRALLLLDPDGVPVAWAGEGLLHELPQELPRSGPLLPGELQRRDAARAQPLGDARRPWRVAAGVSFPTDTLPFPRARGRRAGPWWTIRPRRCRAPIW